jgi:hypothetical protein
MLETIELYTLKTVNIVVKAFYLQKTKVTEKKG